MSQTMENDAQESNAQNQLRRICAEAESLGATPGFMPGFSPVMKPDRTSDFVPAHWSYQKLKPVLANASDALNIKVAERRVLVLRNPKPDNDWPTSRTLTCAYQLMLPGEVAVSHRHTSHALRVLIDAKGTYSVVDGERMPMESGDVVLTPGGHWHGHGHEGDSPAYWLDCLDVPLTRLLEARRMQDHPQRFDPVTRVVEASPFRFSRDGILRSLDQVRASADGVHGPRVLLQTPEMPTVQLAMERLESGVETRSYRSTANRIFVVWEGSGTSVIGESVFHWSRGDTLVAPLGYALRHKAAEDSVLFEISDESLMRHIKYYDEMAL